MVAMGKFREFRREWQARRHGRKHLDHKIRTAARGIIGPTGWQWSNSWDHLEKDGDAYLKSFDPRVPRSIFLTERDANREHIPVPLVERCIEDHAEDHAKGAEAQPSPETG